MFTMAPMEGKVALVTAATEGIGYAIAKRLASEGCHVVISSRKQVGLSQFTSRFTFFGFGLLNNESFF